MFDRLVLMMSPPDPGLPDPALRSKRTSTARVLSYQAIDEDDRDSGSVNRPVPMADICRLTSNSGIPGRRNGRNADCPSDCTSHRRVGQLYGPRNSVQFVLGKVAHDLAHGLLLKVPHAIDED
jgi:hypothetical protein